MGQVRLRGLHESKQRSAGWASDTEHRSVQDLQSNLGNACRRRASTLTAKAQLRYTTTRSRFPPYAPPAEPNTAALKSAAAAP